MVLVSDLMADYPTDKNSGHSYGPFYDALLAPIRESARRVLEIGVYRAGSLQVWRDYFPNAWVHGLDADPKYVDGVSLDRVVTHLGNQNDPAVLRQLGSIYGPFDFVCDDGSHRIEDQITSLLYLWEHVAPGGWYVIEDVQDPPAVQAVFGEWLVDRRQEKCVYDDALLVFQKR